MITFVVRVSYKQFSVQGIQCLADTDSPWAFELYRLFEGFVELKWIKLTKCSSLKLAYSEIIADLEFYLYWSFCSEWVLSPIEQSAASI